MLSKLLNYKEVLHAADETLGAALNYILPALLGGHKQAPVVQMAM